MLFRILYESPSTALHLFLDTPLVFELSGEPPIKVEIREPKTDNSINELVEVIKPPSGSLALFLVPESEKFTADSAIIEAIADFSLPKKYENILLSLSESVVYSEQEYGIQACVKKDNRTISYPLLQRLESEFKETAEFKKYEDYIETKIFEYLALRTENFIKTLYWRCDLLAANHSLRLQDKRFSPDGKNFYPYPKQDQGSIDVIIADHLDGTVRAEIVSLSKIGGQPIYHELLR